MIFRSKTIQRSLIIIMMGAGLLLGALFFKEEPPVKDMEKKFSEWVIKGKVFLTDLTPQEGKTLREKLDQVQEQARKADHPMVAIASLREGLEEIAKLHLTEQNKYLSSVADLSVEIGKNYNGLAQYERAKKYLQGALVINQKLENIQGQGDALRELGILYDRLAQYDRALEVFQGALKNYIQLKQEEEQAQILTDLGEVYSHRGQDQYALEKFGHALDIYLKKQKIDGKNDILKQQGILHRHRQRYTESLKMFEEALGNTKNPKEQADLLMQEGITYRENKQLEKAVPVLERAEFFFGSSQSQDLVKKTEAMIQRGRVHFAQGDYETAVKQFTRSLTLSQEIKNRQGEWESLIHLGFSYNQLKRYDEAQTKFVQAFEVDAQDGFLFVQERLNLYDEIIQLMEIQPFYEVQAIKTFESRQKRVLLSFVAQSPSRVHPKLLEEEERLVHRLEKIEDQFTKAYAQHPVDSNAIQKSTRQLKQWQSDQVDFEKKLTREAPDYYFFRYAEPLTLKSLQGQLSPDEAMLIYHVMKDHTWLWAISHDQFVREKLSLNDRTIREESMNTFYHRSSSRKLNPWLAKLKPQKIYIVPTQTLCYIPFPRTQSYPLIYLPSASSLEYLRTRTPVAYKSCQEILATHHLTLPDHLLVSELPNNTCLIEVTSKPSQSEPPVCSLVATLLYAGVSTVSVKPWLLGPPSSKKVHVAPITFGIQ